MITGRIQIFSKNRLKKDNVFPNVILTRYKKSLDERENFSTSFELKSRRVVLFTVPGAFTPVCTRQHLAGFKQEAKTILNIKFKKIQDAVQKIICVTPDNVDVSRAWNSLHGSPEIDMWADNLGELADKTGLGVNLSGDRGLGYGFMRSAMVINDGKIEWIEIEDTPASCIRSHANNVISYLDHLAAKEK